MASRWRIRHKLLLGVFLVCGILALLLGGTLNGLWSYYLTINSARSKQTELSAAEDFLESVSEIKNAASLAGLSQLPDKSQTARKKLADYEAKLQNTIDHGRDAGNGEHQRLAVAALKKDLDGLDAAATELFGNRMVADGDAAVEDRLKNQLKQPITDLTRDAVDLRNDIRDEITHLENESRNHYQVTLWIVVPTSVLGVLIMAGLMRSFYAWVLHPIRDLEIGVGRVAKGDFSHRIEVRSGDEMEDLAAAFNDMMDRLRGLYDNLAQQVNERSRQLVRSERLASVGFLAAGVAHEINNPLASIAFCSEALEARLAGLVDELGRAGQARDNAEVFGRYLRMIQEEAFRCKNITERLLAFSRTGERRREPTDLARVVQGVLEVTQHLQNAKGKTIVFEPVGGRVMASVNREEIKSVVLNLVVNALDSMEEGGRLTIRLTQRVGTAEIQFTDTGCGMTQRSAGEHLRAVLHAQPNRQGDGTAV